ncbi:Hpt domain protein [Posidoniimonas polymericola]|uniref:Hpt domain protein n=1 Tax=Posidoniimonas polymericola TaxID=2528002 RepID=A0A5C5YQE9_9BACT|nr:Hpt domain-containing protein [Posidoniimonas polymericola]TWT76987.1 Hpt domain protein [Posidoniimonas polymericola]
MDAHSAACSSSLAPFYIDWQDLLDSVGGDAQVLREVVAAYATEIDSELERLDRGLASNDLTTAEKASHKLKSAMRFFRLEPVAAAAERAEAAAENGDHSAASAACAEFGPGALRLLSAIAAWLD